MKICEYCGTDYTNKRDKNGRKAQGKRFCSTPCEHGARAKLESRKKGMRQAKFHPWKRSLATGDYLHGERGEFKPKTTTVAYAKYRGLIKP